MVGYSYFPHWLECLLGEEFFNPCLLHETAKKNEKNIFCLDCCTSICPHCLSLHRSHRLLQIRRYVYHDVVRVDDLEKLIDCSFIQSYTTNSAKVVFLNQRPQSRPFRGSGNICSTCDRSLQDPYLFCSLSCKVQYLVRKEGGLSKYLYECEFLPLPEGGRGESLCYELDEGQMTPESILESPICFRTSSASASSGSGGVGCWTVGCTATTTEVVKKKRSKVFRSPPAEIPVQVNRRKAVPHRSPLY
ncbi:protein RGF1 INDUCIBLE TRANSCRIPTION FACTOR 1-like [Tasmannia lanceolata]|uniref:protein RGF1 INDUCIBLE TRANSCRIPTION FACTOR 1-like n=1 Tax=Tasmannia lanceolata TaxID=3420 RepID=UPI00406436B7